jgi:hypothetical protein
MGSRPPWAAVEAVANVAHDWLAVLWWMGLLSQSQLYERRTVIVVTNKIGAAGTQQIGGTMVAMFFLACGGVCECACRSL